MSNLDFPQIIQEVYEDSTKRLRVEAQIDAVIPGPIEVAIDHTTDSIRLGDGTSYLSSKIVGSQLGLDVYVIGGISSGVNGAIVVGTTPVEAKVGASPLTNRNLLTVMLTTTGLLYWGYSSSVTISTGTRIFRNSLFQIPADPNCHIWLVSDTVGQDVRITEGASA